MKLFTIRWPLNLSGHLFFIFILINSLQCQPQTQTNLITGADRLLTEYNHLLVNKKIGVVFNQTSRLSNGVHLLDTLSKSYNVIHVLSPEHGFKGNIEAGKKYYNSKAGSSQLKFYSLYGKVKKPTKEMLDGIDLLIYDLQDIGVRYYTYISTMFYVMEAAAEYKIPLIILDRPNPLGGVKIEGPVLWKNMISFIGIAQIPIRYGLTAGELAKYFKGEGFIKNSADLDLRIVNLQNWKRENYYDNYYGNKWQKTSPNIPDLNTAIVYPGTCLIEGTNVSEGRGTLQPFLQIGAPFINAKKLIVELQKQDLNGIELNEISFTPISIPGMSTYPKFKGEKCYGIKIIIKDFSKFNSVRFGIKLIYALNKLYPKKFEFRKEHFNKLIGNEVTLGQIKEGLSPKEIFKTWKEGLKKFKITRKKYLLYQ